MARRIKESVEVAPVRDALEEQFDKRMSRSPRSKSGITDSKMQKFIDAAREFARSGDWSNAEGKHFVALYEWMHQEVYGIDSCTTPMDRLGAVSAANAMLRNKFDGKPSDMAAYMRWLWARERGREKWRREEKRDGGRLTWRALFVTTYIYGDYRVATIRGIT